MDVANGAGWPEDELSYLPSRNFEPNQLSDLNLGDVERWKEYMKKKEEIRELDDQVSTEVKKIYPVPVSWYQMKPSSYTPRVLKLGPLPPSLLRPLPHIDQWKLICLNKFMERHQIPDVETLMDKLIPDPKATASIYSSLPANEKQLELLRLLLTVDTVVLHDFMLMGFSPTSNYLFCAFNSITIDEVMRDVLLIGNQIPLSFLNGLANMFPESEEDAGQDYLRVLLEWTTRYYDPFFRRKAVNGETDVELPWQGQLDLLEQDHLLDCIYATSTRIHVVARDRGVDSELQVEESKKHKIEQKKVHQRYKRLPSASELTKAGIRFEACDGNISVIKLDGKKLYLPRILVDDKTEDILRNLLAYEQTSVGLDQFCFYAMVMDSLIDTPKDAKLLVDDNVIDSALGSPEKLAQMWNDLGVSSYGESSERWNNLSDALRNHCEAHWHVWQVELHSTYFSRPWYWIPLIVATLLLICTLLQTIYTIKG